MGCKTSKNVDKANKDVCERRKILAGLHMSKNPDGIETNLHLATERKAKKTYKVPAVKEKVKEEFFPIPKNRKKFKLYQILTQVRASCMYNNMGSPPPWLKYLILPYYNFYVRTIMFLLFFELPYDEFVDVAIEK